MKKFSLLLTSMAIAAILFIGGYEAVENVRYYRWHADFGGTAWLGTVTVPSDNPALMWEYRPHARHKRIRTNNFGLRGADVEVAKAPNTVRIAFVGDSVTLGYGVEEELIFVSVFRDELQKRLPQPVEALNFGVDGYSTPQIAELMRTKVADFQPDHTVYTICLNDFDFTTSAGDKVRYFRKPTSFFLVKLEHLYRKMRGLDFHTHKFRKNRDQVYREILDMKAIAEQAGGSFETALLPIFPQQVNSFAYYPHDEIHQDVEAFAKSQNIPFTDILKVFRTSGGPPRAYSNDVWHPNGDGHRVIGERFAQSFLRHHPGLARSQP